MPVCLNSTVGAVCSVCVVATMTRQDAGVRLQHRVADNMTRFLVTLVHDVPGDVVAERLLPCGLARTAERTADADCSPAVAI